MQGFSGAIKLADMNDYLAPNQACIAPLLKPKGGKAGTAADDGSTAPKGNSGTRVRVEMELSASDASDLRFPGLAASGGAAAALPTAVASGSGGHFAQIRTDPVKKTATVSLNDCLACSGCVTSAETVLITQQSTQELLNVLQANEEAAAAAAAGTVGASVIAIAAPAAPMSDDSAPAPAHPRVVVVSISPQSLAALAHDFGLSLLSCARKLQTFFVRDLKCRALLDTTPAVDMALMEAREEFVARFRESQAKYGGGAAAGAVAAASSASSAVVAASSDGSTVAPSSASPLPVLASDCPGWVCYAEKTQGLEVLRHLSSCKSPQAILASYVKEHWCARQDPAILPSQLYHVTIMPCYDKKLEASRDDFYLASWETRETDVVLATSEVRELLRDKGVDMHALEESPLDPTLWNVNESQTALYRSVDVGASGGYCEHLFRYAARRLFGVALDPTTPLPYKHARNPDFRELSLEVQGKTVLSFALAYGFRNIQNLVRKMKTKKPGPGAKGKFLLTAAAEADAPESPDAQQLVEQTLPQGAGGYHFVEVMACPSGCLNGGGQLRPPAPALAAGSDPALVAAAAAAASTGTTDIRAQKQLVLDLDKLFHEQRDVHEPEENRITQRMYAEWLGGAAPYTGKARELLHTQFHAVQKELANPLGITW